ncbi:MAG: hypothetical protein NVSMB66_1990 [Candidatus Doudnabacteria bacterium]
MVLNLFVKYKKLSEYLYYLLTIVFCFVFGYAVFSLGQKTDLTPYNNTPITLYGQHKLVIVDPKCPVKGKVSKRKKVYHLAGDLWYKKLKKVRCFRDESAAVKAGFVKAKSFQ